MSYQNEYCKKLSSYLLDKFGICQKAETSINGLQVFITEQKTQFATYIYEPSICIILQGKKAVGFGSNMYSYSPQKYLLVCTHIPTNVQIIEASSENPYVSIVLKFTLEQIFDVLEETQNVKSNSKNIGDKSLCLNDLDDELLEPISRLLALLDKPQSSAKFLASLIMKEIIFILLQKNGDFLKNYVLEGSITNQIAKAINEIKTNFDKTINMKDLAKNIGISESSLYQNFKKITSISPLQYQKKIRLEEAKNMLITKNIDISNAAFAVGYESPSQFSREYARMFGMSPKNHIDYLQNRNIA